MKNMITKYLNSTACSQTKMNPKCWACSICRSLVIRWKYPMMLISLIKSSIRIKKPLPPMVKLRCHFQHKMKANRQSFSSRSYSSLKVVNYGALMNLVVIKTSCSSRISKTSWKSQLISKTVRPRSPSKGTSWTHPWFRVLIKSLPMTWKWAQNQGIMQYHRSHHLSARLVWITNQSL